MKERKTHDREKAGSATNAAGETEYPHVEGWN
jgi:hypothetical protein